MTLDELITQLRELPSFVATVPGIVEQLEQIRDRHDREVSLLYELATDAKNLIQKYNEPDKAIKGNSRLMRRLAETVQQVKQLEDD